MDKDKLAQRVYEMANELSIAIRKATTAGLTVEAEIKQVDVRTTGESMHNETITSIGVRVSEVIKSDIRKWEPNRTNSKGN